MRWFGKAAGDWRRSEIRYLCLTLLLLLAACQARQDIHESRFMMGTLVEFTVSAGDRDAALSAIRDAADAMQRVADEFTIYGDKPNAVKAFNRAQPGVPVALPAEVGKVLRQGLRVSRESDGAFSPLLGSLSLLWGFSLPHPPQKPPAAEEIARLLPGAAISMVRFDGKAWRRLSVETRLDFGGIAKGYAIDRGIEALRRHGIRNAIIDAGGDLRAIGSHNGKPWRIGIRHPRKQGKVLGWLEVHGDISIVTSGDYERFFIYHGKRYHHILDPENGYPAKKSISATVIAKNATLADAWSTALFVGGADLLPVLEKKGMQGMLMDGDSHLHVGKASLVPFHPEK